MFLLFTYDLMTFTKTSYRAEKLNVYHHVSNKNKYPKEHLTIERRGTYRISSHIPVTQKD